MNIDQILALVGLSSWGGKIAWVIGIATAIYKFYINNKDKILAIVLRIEKERASENGFTNEEKEDLVVDVFFAEIYPQLPLWVKLLPFRKSLLESIIRKIVKSICGKSSAVKGIVKAEMIK